jgi:hypothetical protein
MTASDVFGEYEFERILARWKLSEVLRQQAIACGLAGAVAIAAREDFAFMQDNLLKQAIAPNAVNKVVELIIAEWREPRG